jgi:hypothetical protein
MLLGRNHQNVTKMQCSMCGAGAFTNMLADALLLLKTALPWSGKRPLLPSTPHTKQPAAVSYGPTLIFSQKAGYFRQAKPKATLLDTKELKAACSKAMLSAGLLLQC